ncbi:MAG: Rv2175c family DNA-binding protein [Actinomycetota bacterium]|nr:Rv2175c family DNA-binding protein [Actinomycetota bacterium]
MSDEPLFANRSRAESFGTVAANYDRYRPGYPDALIDDLVAQGPRDVLDVGCGTGKAAVLLAARGLDVLGVEIDERMAEVARSHGIAVEVGDFENWDAAGRQFDLIICGQAWHWVDPNRGVPKAASVLRPRGYIAVFWNYDELDEPVQQALDAAYEKHAPELLQSVVAGRNKQSDRPHAAAFEFDSGFGKVSTKHYRWERTFTADEWVGMARTHSDHLMLAPDRLKALTVAAHHAIVGLGGSFVAHYGTYALFAQHPAEGTLAAEDVLSFPEVADTLGVPLRRVHQHVRDGDLVAVRNGADGPRAVPALFVDGNQIVKGLPAVIRLLRDAHFADPEIVDWLYRTDDSLPGTPIEALRRNHGREVKRRAQVAGY